jgi:hypothetical protein
MVFELDEQGVAVQTMLGQPWEVFGKAPLIFRAKIDQKSKSNAPFWLSCSEAAAP